MKSLKASVLFLAFACGPAIAGAHAQDTYPNRPIRFVVPWPPGGASDIVARLIGQKVSESLGQPVVIDNKGGAGGMVGSESVAHSAPDGYTMLYGSTGPNAINAGLYKKMPYNPVKDFAGVTQVNVLPMVLMVNPDLPVKSVKELIELARSKPGTLNFGSVGNGSAHHLAAEMFKSMAKIDIVHVPYKGSAPALIDLIAGRIHMHFDTILAADAHIKAGTVRAIAISSGQRAALLPDIPTVAESGLPGFEINIWQNVVVPAGTPTPIVARLNAEIHKALAAPDVQEKLGSLGMITVVNTPEQETARIRAEVAKWSKIIDDSGIEKVE
jgi:tripartite-type tricarboxylate transporter receptor subunit TctC